MAIGNKEMNIGKTIKKFKEKTLNEGGNIEIGF